MHQVDVRECALKIAKKIITRFAFKLFQTTLAVENKIKDTWVQILIDVLLAHGQV